MKEKKRNRTLTNADIQQYDPMIESWLKDHVIKNWNEASLSKNKDHVSLGNTGMTMADIRQHLRAEVCIALYNYNPDYRTENDKSVKESTFVFNHLRFRVGQLMKRLTRESYGYGKWHSNLEEVLWETNED